MGMSTLPDPSPYQNNILIYPSGSPSNELLNLPIKRKSPRCCILFSCTTSELCFTIRSTKAMQRLLKSQEARNFHRRTWLEWAVQVRWDQDALLFLLDRGAGWRGTETHLNAMGSYLRRIVWR